jgi:methionyl-tRNA synthetase
MQLINNKIDVKYLDDYINDLLAKEHDIYDSKFKALDIDFDRFIESVKSQFNNINQVVNKLSKDKIDKTFFEERLNI